jgi:multimeric flavodoxin WrbA
MSKEILVVTGSARREGNSDLLAQAFARGAQAAGHRVTVFPAAQKHIGGCLGCDLCWSQERPCIQKDDMLEAYPLFQKADVLVLASPVYFSCLTAQLKAFLDRTYCFASAPEGQKPRIRESVLLLTAGDGPQSAAFDAPLKIYRDTIRFWEVQDRGVIKAGGLGEKGAIQGTHWLIDAEELGKRI